MKSPPPIPSCSNENFCFHVGDYSFGFNGKDRESEFNSGAYDFGARIHDARLGRWYCIDAHYSKYESLSVYCAQNNNPMFYLDPNGKDIIGWTDVKKDQIYGYGAKICSGSDLFLGILARFQDVTGDITYVNNGPKKNGVSGDLKDVNLEFILDKGTGPEGGSRGGSTLYYDETKPISELTLADFTIKVELYKGELNDNDNSVQILTISHEMGLHVDHFAKLLVQFKNKEITAEQLIAEAAKVNNDDHATISDTETESMFDKVIKEVKESIDDNKNDLQNGVPTGIDTSGRTAGDGEIEWMLETDVVNKVFTHNSLTGKNLFETDEVFKFSKGVYMGLLQRFNEVLSIHEDNY